MDIGEIVSRLAAKLGCTLKKEQPDAVVGFLSVYNSPHWVWKITVLCLSPVSRGAPPFSSTRSSNNCILTEQKCLPYGTKPFLLLRRVWLARLHTVFVLLLSLTALVHIFALIFYKIGIISIHLINFYRKLFDASFPILSV